ncbi:hypothetical protein [Pseudonocardia abyssalis]|jgi:hypothetical protein|uniref:AbrB family transcriptional regulator n=1 Tax=Pseudonocardia abyssalis TaxID=2792008 RepID=A0ABS6URM0_9PSEU|nr:hypothetical protein [Pseudonocardia abyssalis]MBW0114303.1 hypothetical protein [Pseudonocardia abyssalis]MBW0134865.1 hypothetical protein [Pseudonocardia abyssalis]
MSSTASPRPDGGLDFVVDPDGPLHVPDAEVARHGVQPGSHLRIVTAHKVPAYRRSVRGTLTGTADVDALLAALDDAKSERVPDLEQRWA